MKNPLTLAGIEPATFRFLAQHLNHYRGPLVYNIFQNNFNDLLKTKVRLMNVRTEEACVSINMK